MPRKKRTDDTQGKALKQEPKSASWSYVLYLSEIDDIWENIGYAEIRRAYLVFKEYVKHKIGYPHAYILHDKDKEDNGDDKKPHIHIVVNFNRAVSLSWAIKYINDMLGSICTSCVYAEVPYNVKHYINEYLLHIGYIEKYNYSNDELITYGSLYELSYADFGQIIMSCETFSQAQDVCMQDERLTK